MSSTNYNLNTLAAGQGKTSTWKTLKNLIALLPEERMRLVWAVVAILSHSVLTMLGPYIIGVTLNKYILHPDYPMVLQMCGWLLLTYMGALLAIYLRTTLMGGFGQRLLFTLRNAVFKKLLELPSAFFTQNKTGDLISRINNDTDKINQFFSQSLMQFVASLFMITGAGIFLLSNSPELGAATLAPALLLWAFTKLTSAWVKKRNAENLASTGGLSAEIQESLNNFKVIIAFNRRDYFRRRFSGANEQNYTSAVKAGVANNIFMPVSGLASTLGQMIVLTFGIYLISTSDFKVGFLVTYFAYVSYFYDPLRQMAALWSSFQVAMAAWDRISHILTLESDLKTLPVDTSSQGVIALTIDASALEQVVRSTSNEPGTSPNDTRLEDTAATESYPTPPGKTAISPDLATAHPGAGLQPAGSTNGATRASAPLLEFRQVSFAYPDGKEVLHNNSFIMEKGKTYALVGPTGGGKTTTASLIARLYDPTGGSIWLDGRDIRTYTPEERTARIGFILQEPFLFTGTIRDNLLYGNERYKDLNKEELEAEINAANLGSLLMRFDTGLDTEVSATGDGLSLGQKQLIAFMRAVLRNPELLILDEATANIDTVTEQLLEEILHKLPASTTRVIIAHRLNTIENADEIYFVNSGSITRAGSLDQAVDMLLHGKRVS